MTQKTKENMQTELLHEIETTMYLLHAPQYSIRKTKGCDNKYFWVLYDSEQDEIQSMPAHIVHFLDRYKIINSRKIKILR